MKSFIACFLFSIITVSAQVKTDEKVLKVSPLIEGTLLLPTETENPPLAIIIAGSGPTDRNGNQNMMKNNSLRYLAKGLSENGIATFRYDKRSVALLKTGQMNESSVKFDDFIKDAQDVFNYFKKAESFSKIYIIGHSQGSLIGMEVARTNETDGFISIAGAGQTIDNVIVDQLEKQSPAFRENARTAFDELKEN